MKVKLAGDSTRLVAWASRVSVVALGAIVPLIDSSTKQLSSVIGATVTISLWSLWAIALLCVLIPSSTALTALRLTLPTMLVTTAVVVAAHPAGAGPIVALSTALLAVLIAFSAEIGNSYVRVSAYGDERRFLLRCPPAMAVVQGLIWAAWFGLALLTVNLLDRRYWIVGAIAGLAVAGLVAVLPPRFHRFSRRWLVLVPAGLVVHDHVMLSETAMFLKNAVANIQIDKKDQPSDAADLSGGCAGVGLIVSLKDFDTVVLAATPKTPGGRALHVKSMRICPTRPGQALAELSLLN